MGIEARNVDITKTKLILQKKWNFLFVIANNSIWDWQWQSGCNL